MSSNEFLGSTGGEEFSRRQAAALRFAEMQEDTMRLSNLGIKRAITTAFRHTTPDLIVPDAPLYLRVRNQYNGPDPEKTRVVLSITFQLLGKGSFTSWPIDIKDDKLLIGDQGLSLTSAQLAEIERLAIGREPQPLMDFDHAVAHPFLPPSSY